ncbi:MAG: hypothetical protein RL386_1014 [Bacteroidota bacterium]|jgi:hypothetical protein
MLSYRRKSDFLQVKPANNFCRHNTNRHVNHFGMIFVVKFGD